MTATLSNRTQLLLMLAYAALFAWLATRGLTAAWLLCGLTLGLSVALLGLWLRDRDEAKEAAHADDQPPTTVATWTCPDCQTDVPITVRTEHVIVGYLDTFDIRAHVLTHEGA